MVMKPSKSTRRKFRRTKPKIGSSQTKTAERAGTSQTAGKGSRPRPVRSSRSKDRPKAYHKTETEGIAMYSRFAAVNLAGRPRARYSTAFQAAHQALPAMRQAR